MKNSEFITPIQRLGERLCSLDEMRRNQGILLDIELSEEWYGEFLDAAVVATEDALFSVRQHILDAERELAMKRRNEKDADDANN